MHQFYDKLDEIDVHIWSQLLKGIGL